MLQFDEIKVENPLIRSIGDNESIVPKSYQLFFSDDELQDEFIPELQKALDKHDFEIGEEHIHFQVDYDELWGKYKILMDVSYWYLESEGDADIPDMGTVETLYRPIFEDFYKKVLTKKIVRY